MISFQHANPAHLVGVFSILVRLSFYGNPCFILFLQFFWAIILVRYGCLLARDLFVRLTSWANNWLPNLPSMQKYSPFLIIFKAYFHFNE